MKKLYINLTLVLFFVLTNFNLYSQVNFTESNLPIFKIYTLGQAIDAEEKAMMDLIVLWRGDDQINSVNDAVFHYAGKAGIEYKGQSSLEFPKKSFSIELRQFDSSDYEFPLCGLPKESDWVLSGPYSDKSLLRHITAYNLAQSTGRYAPRFKLIELMLDDVYRGVYILMEKIKRDGDRVDIKKLTEDDISGNDLTGGYIIKVDKVDSAFYGWTGHVDQFNYPDQFQIVFQYEYPRGEEIMPQQENYIQEYIEEFEEELGESHFTDPFDGYNAFIDVASFIDYMLVREVGKDVDSYRYSTYFHKNQNSQGGKLKAGPAWDFDTGFGNENYSSSGARDSSGWMYATQNRIWWFKRLMEDPAYATQFETRYTNLRSTVWGNHQINHFIDSVTNHAADAIERNFELWPILGVYVWPNYFVGNTYEEEKDYLKAWINERMLWMDNQFGYSYIDPTLNIEEVVTTEAIKLYPNPAQSIAYLELAENAGWANEIQLFDLAGKMVYNQKLSGFNRIVNIETSQLANGVYLTKVLGPHFELSHKLIVTH